MKQATALSILKLGYTTFLTGPAGSGKSYVLREYITYLKRHGVSYAVTASTGIAATHISGTTIHSFSGIGIKESLSLFELEALEENQALYKRWNATSVLIIDEVSMLHASFLDSLDTIAKHMRRNDKPFGGVQVVFTGDFFQLPPVVKGAVSSSSSFFAFQSRAWKEAKPVVCYLSEQFRQDDDKLSSLLQAIRSGDIDDGYYEMLEEKTEVPHVDDHIKLYTHNENVDAINKEAFSKIEGETRVYEMITKGKASLVQSLKNNCLAEETLTLKVGAKVICIKNAQDRSYVNGSMGKVVSFTNDGAPIIELVSGKRVTIQADSWKIEDEGKVKAEIQQLPVKLAWAITVHKSQGMTLDKAEIDLSRAFVSGQGYVALSRLTSLDGLYLKGFNPQALMISDVVREADSIFMIKSEQAEEALTKYDKEKLEALHEKFLLGAGGSVTEVESSDEEEEPKVPSHLVTKEMLEQKLSLLDIASKRNVSVDTIIGHIEKMENLDKDIFTHILPAKKIVTEVTKAFKELKTDKLTPVFDSLHGKVPYQDIRIIRAAIRNKKS